ncbi:hypothetical protein CL622_01545 [archaeon]|nr:hypothetical protein [archaeon]|tara:strand:- start:256 stop:495 length:240 start_codon:yes stop_codon:yes gene_type:complete
MSNFTTTYKLSDATIAQVAKIVQMAILSGTDIADHMRMMRLKSEGATLVLTEKYSTIFEGQIEKMLLEIEQTVENTLEK